MRTIARLTALACMVCLLLALAPLARAQGPGRSGQAGSDSWKKSAEAGFGAGSANAMAMPIVEFNGKLYAGAANQKGAQLWVKGATKWTRVAGTPFTKDDMAIVKMFVYGGYLYVGTANVNVGCGLWRYDGSAWTDVFTLPGAGGSRGFGDKYNLAVTAMEEFKGELYIGMTNYVLDQISQFKLYTEGIKIWKYDGATWSQLDTSNLDNQYNAGVTSFEVYNNRLYAGTIRFGYSFAFQWPTVLVNIEPKGCQLLRTSGGPGYAWSVAANNGFTSTKNLACLSMLNYMGKLYMGTANATVTVRYNTATQALEGYSYDSDGLSIYSYTGSGSPVELVKKGFGSNNDMAATCMGILPVGGKDRLLVGTASGSGPGKLEVYDGKSWSAGAIDGFGDANNSGIVSLVTVSESGHVRAYAGTLNSSAGCQVWAGTPSSAVYWYLAEGSSDWGFDTLVTIENPNPQVVTARVTYQTSAGARSRPDIKLPALSQTVLNPRNDLGAADFSTRVECVEGKPIAVDRRVTWTGQGAASQEGHSSVGVTAASPVWYLAEGSSNWGFQTWLLIQNPGTAAATCKVTYMVEGVGPKSFTKVVGAGTRATFNMADDIGAVDASIKVVGSQPVICERAMYRNNKREGSDSIGTTGPAKDYYLAEGTTDWGFTTYVLIQNPNGSDNTVNITYMTPTGPVKQAAFVVPANSRKTIRVNDVVPGKDLSAHVQGSLPLIAERAMYWDRGLGEACHDSIGMSNPHATFYLPDGETGNGYETWTLVQNPNSSAVSVAVSYLTPSGAGNVTFTTNVAANSRVTFNMADKIPNGHAAVLVTCKTAGKKIMCERAMYWNNRGAGTDTIGGYSD